MAVDLCGILFDEGILSCKCRGGGGRGKSLHNGGRGEAVGWLGSFESSDFNFTLLLIYYPTADPKDH